MTHEDIAKFVAELRDDAEGERHAWGDEDTHTSRVLDRAADIIEALAEPTNGRDQAHFQHGYESCLCRGDLRPLCCIATGLEAAHNDRLRSIKL